MCVGLSPKTTEAQISKINQKPNYQKVNSGPPLPAKHQGSRNQDEIGYQTLPSSFRSSHKIHRFSGQALFTDSTEDLKKHNHAMKSELKVAKKRMDDSAIGGSETDSSYDDVDAQSLREMNCGTMESNGCLSPSSNVISNLFDGDKKLGSCDNYMYDNVGLLEGQLGSKGCHAVAVKELKNLVHQLSTKVEVHVW